MPTRLLLIAALIAIPSACRAAEPAHVQQASELLDLERLPLPEGAEQQRYRRAAALRYGTTEPSEPAFAYVADRIKALGWKELPGGTHAGGFANAYFERDGFLVYLSASPGGELATQVMLDHKGNVTPTDLPLPTGVKPLYDFPGVAMFSSPNDPDSTAKEIRETMTAAGWRPYGGAGDSAYYRNNAVLAMISTQSAPAQGGATMVSCTVQMLSLELPAPEFADDFRYTDGTTAISFDCDKSAQEVAGYYRQALAPVGWQANTEKPIPIKWKQVTILRNDRQEMITLETHDFEGRTRAKLDHQNAAEVAMESFRQSVEAGRVATYRDGEKPRVVVDARGLPTPEHLRPYALRYVLDEGRGFAAGERLAANFAKQGWKAARTQADRPVIREWLLERGESQLHVLAVDAPKGVSWASVVGVGATLAPGG